VSTNEALTLGDLPEYREAVRKVRERDIAAAFHRIAAQATSAAIEMEQGKTGWAVYHALKLQSLCETTAARFRLVSRTQGGE
jgi:hypothetical protein